MPFRGKGQNKELTHSCFSCFLMFKDVIVSLPQRMQECFYIFLFPHLCVFIKHRVSDYLQILKTIFAELPQPLNNGKKWLKNANGSCLSYNN